jgi:hypothetical protein
MIVFLLPVCSGLLIVLEATPIGHCSVVADEFEIGLGVEPRLISASQAWLLKWRATSGTHKICEPRQVWNIGHKACWVGKAASKINSLAVPCANDRLYNRKSGSAFELLPELHKVLLYSR